MVHVEGYNGAGWMVPKTKAWDAMSEDEQLRRVLTNCNVSCPGWCRTEHYEGPPRPGVSVVMHTWDLITEGAFTLGLEQADWISCPDGDLVQRDPAEVHIRLDVEPDIRAALVRYAGEAEFDAWALDPAKATELAGELRGEKHEWAPPLVVALRTLVDAVLQPRRTNGVEFIPHAAGAAW